MITEEQRRALFALREALHLCEGADVSVSAKLNGGAVHVICATEMGCYRTGTVTKGPFLKALDLDRLLAEHPEP